MRLLSLSAEHFRCIRSAKIQFGPGLNVLHGPNDLGKSSLATAIRAVLLMQASAKEHEAFVDWSGGGDPHVELVFETEPQRIWRIRKTFGSTGAQAFLDESRNEVDFHVEARGRDVDGRLSEILRWGLAPPGGKGRPKGLPVTFLSTALLAEQDEVTAILESGLSGDSDESGKKRLIEALQAVAENPLFKKVLGRVQQKVDEAFSSTGRKRLGKNSPWVQIRDEITRADTYERQCNEQSQKTVAIELELQQLLQEQLERKDAVDNASGILEQIERSHASGKLRKEIIGRLGDCNKRLGEITKAARDLADAEERHCGLILQVAQLREREQSARLNRAATLHRLEASKEKLALLQSEDRERERLLKQTFLEKRRAELRTEQSECEALLARIRNVETAFRRAQIIEGECRSLSERIQELEAQHEKSKQAVRDAEEREQTLRSAIHLFHVKNARRGIVEARKGVDQVAEWREEIGRRRAAAAALDSSLAKLALPSTTELAAIQQLDHQLQLARAGVSVGLHVELRPKRKMKVLVRRDAQGAERHALADTPMQTSADRHILLDLEGIAEIALSGGSDNARNEVERLEHRWITEAQPVLASAGAAALAELVRISEEAAGRRREMEDLRRVADQLEQRVADQRDWASLLASQIDELAASEQALGPADLQALEKLATSLRIVDGPDAQNGMSQIRIECGKLQETERSVDGELMTANATRGEKHKAMDLASEELRLAKDSIDGNWQELLPVALAKTGAIKSESDGVEAELETLSTEANRSLLEAQTAAGEAERDDEHAECTHREAEKELRDAENRQARSEGELRIRRETTAKLDEASARVAVEQLQAELRDAPEPASEITDEMLEEARDVVQGARNRLREIENEIQGKQGALEHVGGEVAKERAQEAVDALHRVRQREQELEHDYAAWELLRNTLREAEQEEGVHLGRALGDPIARRFSDLTDRRYGTVTLGPDLETNGVGACGDSRLVSALSVGTRDQLSTIFRLSLAEQLQSTVMLDDQLTQSDAQRMVWLRDLLRQLAAKIQILVFTCRPADYLLPAELKASKKSEPAASFVRSIDLASVIHRS